MSNIKKHVGRIKNTDRRCVVVYMTIPGREDHALIVDTDSLPDRYHDALLTIVDSPEAQQAMDLHNLLSRRILPDLGVDILSALHQGGFLRPVSVDNVVMFPRPNQPMPLRTIVDLITAEAQDAKDTSEHNTQEVKNRILENQKVDASQAELDIAANILRQAEDLENEARRKREQAYAMAPALRPQVTPSPQVTEASESADTVEAQSAPEMPSEDQAVPEQSELQDLTQVAEVIPADADLPPEVAEALNAAIEQGFIDEVAENNSQLGNQVDTSDDALQEFLDRAALREDMADKERWAALQPKNPVGRPRKDGTPAGSAKVAAPAPKKRGRPPKAAK